MEAINSVGVDVEWRESIKDSAICGRLCKLITRQRLTFSSQLGLFENMYL